MVIAHLIDILRMKQRGSELNRTNTRFYDDFVKGISEIHENHPWLLFRINLNHYVENWKPLIVIRLLTFNQNRISLDFWFQKRSFWSKWIKYSDQAVRLQARWWTVIEFLSRSLHRRPAKVKLPAETPHPIIS